MNDLISLTEGIESETGKRIQLLVMPISRPLSLWQKENPDWLLYTRWIDEQKRIRKWQSKSCWTPFPTKFIQSHPIMEKSLEIMRKSQRDWNAVFILPMRTLPGKEGPMKTPTVSSVNTLLKIGTLEPLRIRSWSTPWKDSTIVQGKDLGIKHPIKYSLENHTMLHLLLESRKWIKQE